MGGELLPLKIENKTATHGELLDRPNNRILLWCILTASHGRLEGIMRERGNCSSDTSTLTLNFGESASMGTGITMSTLLAVERRLNWLLAYGDPNGNL